MMELTRKEYKIITKNFIEPQNMSPQELINTLSSRYDSRRRIKNIRRKKLKLGLEKIAKIQNISKITAKKINR